MAHTCNLGGPLPLPQIEDDKQTSPDYQAPINGWKLLSRFTSLLTALGSDNAVNFVDIRPIFSSHTCTPILNTSFSPIWGSLTPKLCIPSSSQSQLGYDKQKDFGIQDTHPHGHCGAQKNGSTSSAAALFPTGPIAPPKMVLSSFGSSKERVKVDTEKIFDLTNLPNAEKISEDERKHLRRMLLEGSTLEVMERSYHTKLSDVAAVPSCKADFDDTLGANNTQSFNRSCKCTTALSGRDHERTVVFELSRDGIWVRKGGDDADVLLVANAEFPVQNTPQSVPEALRPVAQQLHHSYFELSQTDRLGRVFSNNRLLLPPPGLENRAGNCQPEVYSSTVLDPSSFLPIPSSLTQTSHVQFRFQQSSSVSPNSIRKIRFNKFVDVVVSHQHRRGSAVLSSFRATSQTTLPDHPSLG